MLASARDHKRAFDGGCRPEYRGMGAFSPADNFGEELRAQFDRTVMQPLHRRVARERCHVSRSAFPGLDDHFGWSARARNSTAAVGDPESQAILPRLEIGFALASGSDDRRQVGSRDDRMG